MAKPVTYRQFLKNNDIPKDKKEPLIPTTAVLLPKPEVPKGLNSSLRSTDGTGIDTLGNLDGRSGKIEILNAKYAHGEWFTWPNK